MEENTQLIELLERMEKNSRRQVRLGRLQCLFSLAAAVFCGAAFLLLLNLLPQLLAVLPEIDAVLSQMQGVLSNLETATGQLAQIDLSGMVTGVDTLVSTAQQGLTETMNKLNTIDFQTLNKAIEDLAAVVEPLSKISKMFS
ncbi:MAG: hypothetical protein J6J12_02705 [Oscillospiraceae bacterium]|nr:hypothetical protein [Oscillospiraceae bacterium]